MYIFAAENNTQPMKRGTKSPYDAKMTKYLRIVLTDKQHSYVKAKALLDGKHIQDVVRDLIEAAYKNERNNGTDIVAIARENGLL